MLLTGRAVERLDARNLSGGGAASQEFLALIEHDIARQAVSTSKSALPHGKRPPSMHRKRFTGLRVPLPVPRDFCIPELPARHRHLEEVTAVPVPEAAMHEDGGAIPRKYKIGATWEVARLEAKAETTSVQPPPDHQLRLGVATADAAHVVTSPLR